MKLKRLITILFCFLLCGTLWGAAKEKGIKTVMRTWSLPAPTFRADTLPVDTSRLTFPLHDMLNDYSISNAWNGNIISPVQSRLWFARQKKTDDIFSHSYTPFVITANDVRFYNTTVPYSDISYKKGFTTYHEENELAFMFTGNLNRRINLGLQLNYTNGAGHYMNQEASLFNGAVFGSYNGNHYSLQAAITWNTLKNFENGGLIDVSELAGSLQPEDIPVRIKGMSALTYIDALLNHYYSLTVEKEHLDSVAYTNELGQEEWRDTVRIDYIPVITFAHTFQTTNSVHRYIEQTADQNFFQNIYRNPFATNDSANVLTIRNTLTITFEEEFNRRLRFGANVYAYNECQSYLYGISQSDFNTLPSAINNTWEAITRCTINQSPDSLFTTQWTNNTFIGGSIYKNTGKWIRYGFNGDVCLLGYKLGEFQVNGHIDGYFLLGKDTMSISARAYVKNETPTWYEQHLVSNHFHWDNDFSKTYRIAANAQLSYPTKWIKPKINFGFENISNYIWYDQTGMIRQHNGHIQIFSLDIHADLTTPYINLENNIVYQLSTSDIIPLPTICLYHNLYYHGSWFKRAMDAQIGVDMRYFTRYYSPILNPATGQFCVQHEQKIGNYPVINAYASFYIRLLHLRLFVQYTHFNRLFDKDNINYMAMPGYPMNNDVFRAGLAWHFYK